MTILGIETSCDDTGVAVLEITGKKNPVFKVLSNIVSSQVEIHKKYGGVFPSLAKREHQKNLPIVLKRALKEAENQSTQKKMSARPSTKKDFLCSGPKIEAVAITVGPGLEPCLWVGVNFVKELAKKLNVPIIPVDHIEAHILANFVGSNYQLSISNLQIIFPAMCLVVSGGHTQLILMKGFGKYKIIGETLDDAAGECFDKTARILGLGYPGGPEIARLAAQFQPSTKTNFSALAINLPRPMIHHKNYNFSFSGLKTAVLYFVKALDNKTKKNKSFIIEMCREIQQAVIDVLVAKTIKAAQEYKAKMIILGGGVTANEELRKQFQLTINNKQLAINFLVPPKSLCTDNAVMIAAAAYFNQDKATMNWESLEADANLRIT